MPQPSEPNPSVWAESDSETFIDFGRYFVPDREVQMETLCDLIPAAAGPVHMVDLCCGAGLLCGAMLERFDNATIHGYDRSPKMLAHASAELGRFGDRFEPVRFDLTERRWRKFPWPVHAAVSSLAIHHLPDEEKRRLFGDVAAALSPGGVFIVADLIKPTSEPGRRLAAKMWDESVRRRSLDLFGSLEPFECFTRDGWNFFSDRHPDPEDQPSPLADQLHWLEAAGLTGVDVHWMHAGHAIFGGTKPSS